MASMSTSGIKGKDKVMGAFDGIAPSAPASTSTSTSASKLMKKPSYDIFINHRGPDVKSTLATVLYSMLTDLALSVFLDKPELEYGDFLPRTIEAAMSSALLHIAIFSERYAESPWCLAELSFMLESGAPIIPIFYHVEPTDLRYVDQGKGIYADAFKKHEHNGRYSSEKLQEWKKALHVVSFYSGEIIKKKEDEDRQLRDIVNTVWKKTKNVLLKAAKHPVGLEEIVQDIETSTIQSVESDKGVQIIGIWGMGGSGKTTLAKELYNKRSSLIGWSSFVSNVRDASTKGLLYKKQKKILEDLGVQNVEFDNIEEGKEALSRHLRFVRVLVVLDDVDDVDQLDALLPAKDGLKRGSLIIVTTRECDVLRSWGITSIYKMKELKLSYAKQLFCWYVFKQSIPWDGFDELVKKFLDACHGLPLALKVIGAELCNEFDKECWESVLHKIKRTLPINIQRILQISYDSLDDEGREMFLDVACFFIGENSSLVIELWNGMGWSGRQGWKKLYSKCLVEFDDYNCINMHDHIRDLGRDIAIKQSPFRLWFPQPIINVHQQAKKRIGIQGIIATANRVDWIPYMYREQNLPQMVKVAGEIDEFQVHCSHGGELMVKTTGGIWPLSTSLVGLKFLVISGDSFTQAMGEMSRDLVWLRWFQIGRRNLPSGLLWKNLRVLELYEKYDTYGLISSTQHQLEELWGETDSEAPMQLRELLISNCYRFQGFPKSVGYLNHLKKMVIVSGKNVRSLPEEFCLLKSLEHLVLDGCKMLSLPRNFGNLSNLRHLDLSRSSELRRLPASFKNMMLLEHLNLQGCSQLAFMSEDLGFLEKITKLEFFNLDGCKQLEELPHHITNQEYLRELYLSGTSLKEVPDNIGQLDRLRKMKIRIVLSKSLPSSLGDLSSLMELSVASCPMLEHLPDSLGGLSSLTKLSIALCFKLERPPDSLGDLSALANLRIEECSKLECLPDSLGNLSSLTSLYIRGCHNLESLPDSLGNLSSLTNLEIISCFRLENLPKSVRQLRNLQRLSINSCPIREVDFGAAPFISPGLSNLKSIRLQATAVCRISIFKKCCPSLEELHVYENHLNVFQNQHLEAIDAWPTTLKYICLKNCEMLNYIPSCARLTSLRKFVLKGCYEIEKIQGIENCTRLKELSINTCWEWEVPGIESFQHMQNLKRLELKANHGSVMARYIQTIQKWPADLRICSRVVRPDAASVVDSLLSLNVVLVDFISNQKIESWPKLVQRRSSNGDAFMVCVVIDCLSPNLSVRASRQSNLDRIVFEEGRWLWVRIFTQRSQYFIEEEFSIEGCDARSPLKGAIEKGLVLRGEEQTIMEALRSLLPLFQDS